MEDIGIYTNINFSGDFASDGHKYYNATCKYCGQTFRRLMSEINRNHTYCQHNIIPIKNRRLRKIYIGMLRRCYRKENTDYRFYGNLGIKICDEWMNFPDTFEKWSLSNGYTEKLTIDRIDGHNNYCPENCRWISPEENSRDKISTRYISVNGFKLSGRQWADKLNVSTNFINTYFRNNGEEATIEYIKNKLV